MSMKAIICGIVVLIVIFLLSSCLFVVSEGQSALLLRLGRIVTDGQGNAVVFAPGLHAKAPFINSVYKFDTRLQNLDAESPRILTAEQKYLYVDYFAKWKITNGALYYTRTGGNLDRTQSLLTQKINDAIRNQFGKRTLQAVIADDRLQIMQLLRQSANEGAQNLGIEIIDVRIKSIDLLKQVLASVFLRMSTKREQVATEYRSLGQAQSETIRATADAQAQKVIADAERISALTRANGDAKAADIYLQAYNQDPNFYALYRSLEAYRQVFTNKDNIMVLKPDSEFFKYFNQSQVEQK